MSILVARNLRRAMIRLALCSALPTASLAGDSIGLYDAVNKRFHLKDNAESGVADRSLVLSTGLSHELTVIGDWNGDGRDTVGSYDPYLGRFKLTNRQRTTAAELDFAFGPKQAGLQVVSGDWNGDGLDTVGVYDQNLGVFWLNQATGYGKASHTLRFGPAGMNWLPIAGDWNGDGVDSIGLYDPLTATFHLRNELKGGRADLAFKYGPIGRGWHVLTGDWNGDGIDTVALYDHESGRFHLRNENSPGLGDASFGYGPAGLGWLPVVGQWQPEKPIAELADAETAVVLFEAEDYTAHDARRGIRWQSVDMGGHSGRSSMEVLPLGAAKVDTITENAVGRLDYRFNVREPGRYYILLRGMGRNGGQNSVHAGLDGVAVTSAANIQFATGVGWTWSSSVRYVDVATPGPHVLNLWMRESGTIVDSIVVTPSQSMTPQAAESIVANALTLVAPAPTQPKPRSASAPIAGSGTASTAAVEGDSSTCEGYWDQARKVWVSAKEACSETSTDTDPVTPVVDSSTCEGYWDTQRKVWVSAKEACATNDPRTDTDAEPRVPTTSVTLTWRANSEPVVGYRVYFGTSSASSTLIELAQFRTSDSSFPADSPRAEFRSYEDLGLSPGDQACFRLRAYDKSGVSGFGEAVCVKI